MKHLITVATILSLCPAALAQTAPTCRNGPSDYRLSIAIDGPSHPINPAIYGVNFATTAVLRDLNIPINRSGGNSASLYDWRADARSTGADFYYESLPVTDAITDQFHHGFVERTRAGQAQPMVTIPAQGWVARLGPDRGKLAAFSIARYGAQADRDSRYFPDAGNGVRPDGSLVTGNDPNDAARPVDSAAEARDRVRDLVARWGTADRGGVGYYIIDNEPSLWHITHRNVQPTGAHADAVADKIIDVARAIHAVDPAAKVVAPEEWGWPGYLHSGFDQQARASKRPDAELDRQRMTGGLDYLPYLLEKWRAAGAPVDMVSVHFYPQGGEFPGGGAESRDTMLLRNQSTRLLWDRAYRETGWIGEPVALIPRLRGWVDAHYISGTPIAITEYDWGAEDTMNGAVAQADIWGIFGRERLDLAARWMAPRPDTPVYRAMRLIRNADGHGGGFGAVSLPVAGADPDRLSAYAARRADGTVTLLAINKQLDAPASVRISLSGRKAAGRSAIAYRLSQGVLESPQRVGQTDDGYCDSLPPQSIALYVIASDDG